MGKRKYFTEEERLEAKRKSQREANKRYQKTHNYLQKIKIENPILYRATKLINNYRCKDKIKNRGKSDLTVRWLIENILLKPCAHCGETDWHKIGCNRIDNDLPHTKDNVEPCCEDCNNQLNYKDRRKKVYQYTLDGEFMAEWDSAKTAAIALGHTTSSTINSCCLGYCKTAYKYRWSYESELDKI